MHRKTLYILIAAFGFIYTTYGQDSTIVLKGYVTSVDDHQRNPLKDILISFSEYVDSGRFVEDTSFHSSDEELFNFTIKPNTRYRFTGSKQGYWPLYEEVEYWGEKIKDTVFVLLAIKKVAQARNRNIYFQHKSTTFQGMYLDELDSLAKVLFKYPDYTLEILGHCEPTEFKASNDKLQLSIARAQNVANALTERGIEKSRITVQGKNDTQPIAPNENPDGSDNPVGRQKNRRVEFKVIKAIDDPENEYIENEPESVTD